MLKLIPMVCLLVAGSALQAQSGKDVPAASLPAAMREARKVFLTSNGTSALAREAFSSAMKSWGRYEIVGSPDVADLNLELAYWVGNGRTWLHDEDYRRPGPPVAMTTLTVLDAKSNRSLWRAVDRRKLAIMGRNREKDAVSSAQKLVGELKTALAFP